MKAHKQPKIQPKVWPHVFRRLFEKATAQGGKDTWAATLSQKTTLLPIALPNKVGKTTTDKVGIYILTKLS